MSRRIARASSNRPRTSYVFARLPCTASKFSSGAPLLGDVFTGGGPRCWPEFGLQWARENGFVPVRVQPGDPCAFQYPFLYLSKPCKAGALLVNSLF